MSCPNCGAPVSVTDSAGNPWYSCGSHKTFRSATCIDREPFVTELRKAQSRINKLRVALKFISGGGYRGNVSPESSIAAKALLEDETP